MTSDEYALTLQNQFSLIVCVVVLLVLTTSTQAAVCPSPCVCSGNEQGPPTFVNCRSKKLTGMISNIPLEVTELDLSENPLMNISRSSFPSLPNLRKLSMENCGLERLERLTFRNLELLEVLKLSRNRWSFVL